jgi:hypothetical protein
MQLLDANGDVIAFFHPTRPTRYQIGDVYGELHFVRSAGAGTVVSVLHDPRYSRDADLRKDAPSHHGHGHGHCYALPFLCCLEFINSLIYLGFLMRGFVFRVFLLVWTFV